MIIIFIYLISAGMYIIIIYYFCLQKTKTILFYNMVCGLNICCTVFMLNHNINLFVYYGNSYYVISINSRIQSTLIYKSHYNL